MQVIAEKLEKSRLFTIILTTMRKLLLYRSPLFAVLWLVLYSFFLYGCGEKEAAPDIAPDNIRIQLSGEFTAEEAFPGFEKEVVVLNGVTFLRYEDYYIFQGDIVLTREEAERMGESITRSAVTANQNAIWPNQTVYYVADQTLSYRSLLLQAMSEITNATGIRFTPWSSSLGNDYIEFLTCEWGNYSNSIGRKQGKQEVGIEIFGSKGTILHEIGHALGLYHEQSRADRDNHIIVLWENIEQDRQSLFQFATYVEQNRPGRDKGNFDFNSIMLYDSYSFTRNGQPTMIKRDSSTFSANRSGLSEGDILSLSALYSTSVRNLSITKPNGNVEENQVIDLYANFEHVGNVESIVWTIPNFRVQSRLGEKGVRGFFYETQNTSFSVSVKIAGDAYTYSKTADVNVVMDRPLIQGLERVSPNSTHSYYTVFDRMGYTYEWSFMPQPESYRVLPGNSISVTFGTEARYKIICQAISPEGVFLEPSEFYVATNNTIVLPEDNPGPILVDP